MTKMASQVPAFGAHRPRADMVNTSTKPSPIPGVATRNPRRQRFSGRRWRAIAISTSATARAVRPKMARPNNPYTDARLPCTSVTMASPATSLPVAIQDLDGAGDEPGRLTGEGGRVEGVAEGRLGAGAARRD